MSRTITVRELAGQLGGEVLCDSQQSITGVSSLKSAGPGDLVFVDSPRYLEDLKASRAGAAIVPEGIEPPPGMSGIRVRQPQLAMARALEILLPHEKAFEGVSPQAVLELRCLRGDPGLPIYRLAQAA